MNIVQCLTRGHDLGLPRLESQILLLHALSRPLHDRAWLLAHDTDELAPSTVATFDGFVQRRLLHEPIAYIVGQKEIFGLTLKVDKRVLDPRDDTEVLVEWALACAASVAAPRFLDLGQGAAPLPWPFSLNVHKPK